MEKQQTNMGINRSEAHEYLVKIKEGYVG